MERTSARTAVGRATAFLRANWVGTACCTGGGGIGSGSGSSAGTVGGIGGGTNGTGSVAVSAPLADWGRQLLLLASRWLPGRRVIAVADITYAVIELLAALRHRLTMVTRLRLDARLFDPPPPH